MQYTERKGMKISNMTLGTSQLGFNYGIANKVGQPGEKECMELLRFTVENGVSSLDTARGYGDSEQRIGTFFKEYKARPPYITTKLRVGLRAAWGGADVLSDGGLKKLEGEVLAMGDQLEKNVFESAETSLSTLGVAKVNCIMLHDSQEMKAGGGRLAKIMGKLVNAGYADEVGASIYHPHEADAMLQYDEYTATQFPMNLFDQKMIHSDTLRKLKDRNFVVFIRSVFLQGLFFLEPDEVEEPLLVEHAVSHIRTLRQLARDEGVSVAQLAISFVRDSEGVTSLVLGSETIAQIRENIRFMEGPPLSEKTMEAARKAFQDVNYEGIMEVLKKPKF